MALAAVGGDGGSALVESGAAGASGDCPASLFTRLRSVLRSPLYRAECRQFGRHWTLAMFLIAVGGLCAPMAGLLLQSEDLAAGLALLWAPLPLIPGVLVAESILGERSSGTLEAALLTPVARDRLLWAKVLARARALLWAALLCPAIGLLYGLLLWLVERRDADEMPVALIVGALAGLATGAFLVGETFTTGAVATYFAVRLRRRPFIYLACATATLCLHGIEFAILAMVWGTLAMADRMLSTVGIPELATQATALGLFVLVILARVALVNLVLPDALLAHAGCQFDRRQLREAT